MERKALSSLVLDVSPGSGKEPGDDRFGDTRTIGDLHVSTAKMAKKSLQAQSPSQHDSNQMLIGDHDQFSSSPSLSLSHNQYACHLDKDETDENARQRKKNIQNESYRCADMIAIIIIIIIILILTLVLVLVLVLVVVLVVVVVVTITCMISLTCGICV